MKKKDKISLKMFGRLSKLFSSSVPSTTIVRIWKQLVLSRTALIGSAPHFLSDRSSELSSFLEAGTILRALKSMATNSRGLLPVWFRISFQISHPFIFSCEADSDCKGFSTKGSLTQICGGALTTFTLESRCRHRDIFGSRNILCELASALQTSVNLTVHVNIEFMLER